MYNLEEPASNKLWKREISQLVDTQFGVTVPQDCHNDEGKRKRV